MSWNNVPDDWDDWYYNCVRCGRRCHASEGCDCMDDYCLRCEEELDDQGNCQYCEEANKDG